MSKGFNKVGFMEFLVQSFSGFENHFLRETVENLIDYSLEHENHSLDQACYFLSNILPEVEFAEVAMFMDDSLLTAHGREVKHELLEDLNEASCIPITAHTLVLGLSKLDDLVSAASDFRESELNAVIDQLGEVFPAEIKNTESFIER